MSSISDFFQNSSKTGGYQDGTWERLNPHHTDQKTYLFHLTRYQFALEYIRSKGNVLDVGCGTGYGAFLISQIVKYITAIDSADEAITYAREYYPADNLDYIRGDWREGFTDRTYDAVLAFEFLEHISEQEEFIGAVHGHLEKDGIFILSTPNKNQTLEDNPFHRREVYPQELKKLLLPVFRQVTLLGQYVRPEFSIRQQSLLHYIEMQSFMPKWLRRIRRPYTSAHRQALISEMIGLTASDILITRGDYAIEGAKFLIAICRP